MSQVIVPENTTVAELSELTASSLYLMQSMIVAQAASLKAQNEKLTQAVERRYVERAKQARANENKDTGTVRFEDNGFEIEADLPKKVEWDIAELRKAFDTMEPEDAAHYAKVELSVEERKFTSAPPAIQKLLQPARTVKTGKQKFVIHQKKASE